MGNRLENKVAVVTGAGRALKPRGSDVFVPKVEQGNTKGLSSILANLAELCPDDCQKSIEYQSASETAANVSLTLFVTSTFKATSPLPE